MWRTNIPDKSNDCIVWSNVLLVMCNSTYNCIIIMYMDIIIQLIIIIQLYVLLHIIFVSSFGL